MTDITIEIQDILEKHWDDVSIGINELGSPTCYFHEHDVFDALIDFLRHQPDKITVAPELRQIVKLGRQIIPDPKGYHGNDDKVVATTRMDFSGAVADYYAEPRPNSQSRNIADDVALDPENLSHEQNVQSVEIGIATETDSAFSIAPDLSSPNAPNANSRRIKVSTAEEIESAITQRIIEAPDAVLAEAENAKAINICLQDFLRDQRRNSDEFKEAEELLGQQERALNQIIANLQSGGDKQEAQETLKELLFNFLSKFLELASKEGPLRGLVAALALTTMSVAGLDIHPITQALVAGSIVSKEVLTGIVKGWRQIRGKGK